MPPKKRYTWTDETLALWEAEKAKDEEQIVNPFTGAYIMKGKGVYNELEASLQKVQAWKADVKRVTSTKPMTPSKLDDQEIAMGIVAQNIPRTASKISTLTKGLNRDIPAKIALPATEIKKMLDYQDPETKEITKKEFIYMNLKPKSKSKLFPLDITRDVVLNICKNYANTKKTRDGDHKIQIHEPLNENTINYIANMIRDTLSIIIEKTRFPSKNVILDIKKNKKFLYDMLKQSKLIDKEELTKSDLDKIEEIKFRRTRNNLIRLIQPSIHIDLSQLFRYKLVKAIENDLDENESDYTDLHIKVIDNIEEFFDMSRDYAKLYASFILEYLKIKIGVDIVGYKWIKNDYSMNSTGPEGTIYYMTISRENAVFAFNRRTGERGNTYVGFWW